MNTFLRLAARLFREDSGQDLIEYALICGVVGLGLVATTKNLTTSIGTVFTAVGTTLTTAV